MPDDIWKKIYQLREAASGGVPLLDLLLLHDEISMSIIENIKKAAPADKLEKHTFVSRQYQRWQDAIDETVKEN